jgi:hypothetical protein
MLSPRNSCERRSGAGFTTTCFRSRSVRPTLPLVRRALPVHGRFRRIKTKLLMFKHLGTSDGQSQRRQGDRKPFDLCCISHQIFCGKVAACGLIWRHGADLAFCFCCVEFKLFNFRPKLTTLFVRSRLGEVPPLRPLVYLLDGI